MRSDGWSFWLLLSIFNTMTNAQNNSCAGTQILNATTQLKYLTTPNYDTSYKYPPFLDCRFIIKAPDKTRVSIEIINMEMEPRIFEECSDFISLSEDYPEKNTSNSKKICSEVKNYEYISSANTMVVTFQTDDLLEYRGAQLSYRYFDLNSCPPSWIELSDGNCVKLENNQKLDWLLAQNRCMEQQSNLVMIDTNEKTSELETVFKIVPNRLWIGYNDAGTEGRLLALDDKEPKPIIGRDPSRMITDNNDENDCMTLQFGDNSPYRMDNCASYNGFICEMKKDGTTIVYRPSPQEIEDGSYSKNSQYTLWILLFIIGLLFFVFLAFLCFICWKQKDGRVHTESTTIQQNAFMTDSSQRVEQTSRTSGGGQNNTVSHPPTNPNVVSGARSSPVTVPVENNRQPIKRFPNAPGPNRLPLAEDLSEAEHITETAILSADGNGAPIPHPRTLPPMPAREGTFQSIKTTEGSTMRTRRNKELFERPIMNVLDNVSAISLDEFWSNKRP